MALSGISISKSAPVSLTGRMGRGNCYRLTHDAARQYLGPYLVIRTAAGQRLQQTVLALASEQVRVGVKNDASHSRRGY